MSIHQTVIKRIFDITLSAAGLVSLWPVFLICIFIASWDTRLFGLFTQTRVGQRGRLIKIRKIRTMREVVGHDTTVTVFGDQRITRIGSHLRKWKLDELPQLWNVLIGDMSFVGPRPDVPGYADKLVGKDREILQLKPGITGPATIKYRNEEMLLSFSKDAMKLNTEVIYPDKVRINLEYMRNWSLLKDVSYILMTIRIFSVPLSLRTNQSDFRC